MPSPSHHHRRAFVAAGLTVALVALASACGGSDGPSTASTLTPAPPDATVSIVDGRFDPRRVEVAVGGSVTWVNDDLTPHLIVSTEPNVIGSPLIGKADTYTRDFSAPGEYRYYCTIHNSMKGVVTAR
jgi:plastocyanin